MADDCFSSLSTPNQQKGQASVAKLSRATLKLTQPDVLIAHPEIAIAAAANTFWRHIE